MAQLLALLRSYIFGAVVCWQGSSKREEKAFFLNPRSYSCPQARVDLFVVPHGRVNNPEKEKFLKDSEVLRSVLLARFDETLLWRIKRDRRGAHLTFLYTRCSPFIYRTSPARPFLANNSQGRKVKPSVLCQTTTPAVQGTKNKKKTDVPSEEPTQIKRTVF